MSDESKATGKIYWEKQESQCCAVHCVNNLLQGPYFTAYDFGEIAQVLDAKEKELMAQAGIDSPEYITYLAQDSNNVDDSGNFSIEVIKTAMQNMGLEVQNIAHEEAKEANENMCAQPAFVLHLHAHWFCVRKIGDKWFNLDSLNDDGPTFIGDLYLSAYLDAMKDQGWSIFVIKGAFPRVRSVLRIFCFIFVCVFGCFVCVQRCELFFFVKSTSS